MGTGRQMADYALGAYDVQGGYIYGQQGAEWTAARQAAMERNKSGNPDYAESIKYGAKWIGHRVWDCSGLTRQAAAAAGASIHHGSNSTWLYDCSHKGDLTAGMALPIGAFVFVHKNGKRTHIGTVTGENEVTEASCARLGVIKSKVHGDKWHEWGLCKNVTFDFIPGEDPGPVPPEPTPPGPDKKPTLRKGDSGPYVTLAQTELIQRGYDLGKWGADGKFGAATESAVKLFQQDWELTVDGVIGPKTWDMLESTPVRVYYTVTVPHLSLKDAEALAALYPGSRIEKEAEV